MALRTNIAANLASQAYVAGVGILALPIYLELAGEEHFALISLFAVLQAWFGLVDLGIAAVVGRQMARHLAGAVAADKFRREVRAFVVLFLGLIAAAAAMLLIGTGYVSQAWLRPAALSAGEVQRAIELLILAVAVRASGGVYRALISGAERQVWLGAFSVVAATVRFVGVIPAMLWFGASAETFFGYQVGVGLVEAAALAIAAHRLLPAVDGRIGIPLRAVAPHLPLAGAVAVTSILWLVITQADRVLLSGLLALGDFGHFMLVTTAAGGLAIMASPVTTALLPRMTRLLGEGRTEDAFAAYRRMTQLMVVLCGAAAITLAVAAEDVMFAWTGSRPIAAGTAEVLALYSIGGLLMNLATLPQQTLQYALGRMRLNVVGYAGLAATFVAALWVLAGAYGALGAAIAWASSWGLFFLVWVPIVHRVHRPGLHLRWLVGDVLRIIVPIAAAAVIVRLMLPAAPDRLGAAGATVALAVATLAAGGAASTIVRQVVRSYLLRLRPSTTA